MRTFLLISFFGFLMAACCPDGKSDKDDLQVVCSDKINGACIDDFFDDNLISRRDPAKRQDWRSPSDVLFYSPEYSIRRASSYENLRVSGSGSDRFRFDGECLVDAYPIWDGIRIQVRRPGNRWDVEESSGSCLVQLLLRYEAGYAFRPVKIEANLVSRMNRASRADFMFNYYVRSSQAALSYTKFLEGRQREVYPLNIEATRKVWSSCSGREILGMSTNVRVDESNRQNGYRPNLMFLEEGEYTIRLEWAACE